MGINTTCLDPGDDHLPYVQIVTLKASQKGRMVVTCNQPYEVYTHYIGGRTLPCMGEDCAACAEHRPKKYEGFVSGVWAGSKRHEILRLTIAGMMQAKTAIPKLESWRGFVFDIERKGTRNNGRVVIHVQPQALESTRLPAGLELEDHLLRVWRIDGIRATDDERSYIFQYQQWLDEVREAKEKKDAS
jgi:hypothetical protein